MVSVHYFSIKMLWKFKVNTLQILIELIFKLITGRKPA